MEGKISKIKDNFKCTKCGGNLKYDPEVLSLKCPFCGEINIISDVKTGIKEEDYEKFITEMESKETYVEKQTAECSSCGAIFSIKPEVISTECPFCASPVILHEKITKIIRPKAIHPFKISPEIAREKFGKWIKKRWFLPTELKGKVVSKESLSGVYLPYWTYDANTISYYSGERGTERNRKEPYTVTEDGKMISKVRDVKYMEWNPASGVIFHPFNDVLVQAGDSIPDRFTGLLEPWNLKEIKPFKEEYLSGFKAEKYKIGVKAGFKATKEKMESKIRDLIKKEIGGDEQKIHSVNSSFDKISFKHILLPLWMSSFRYKNKVYRFMVNGVTGELQGDRPWSKWKLLLFFGSIIAVIAALIIIF